MSLFHADKVCNGLTAGSVRKNASNTVRGYQTYARHCQLVDFRTDTGTGMIRVCLTRSTCVLTFGNAPAVKVELASFQRSPRAVHFEGCRKNNHYLQTCIAGWFRLLLRVGKLRFGGAYNALLVAHGAHMYTCPRLSLQLRFAFHLCWIHQNIFHTKICVNCVLRDWGSQAARPETTIAPA